MNRPATPPRLSTSLRAAIFGIATLAIVGLALVAGQIGRWTSRTPTGTPVQTVQRPTLRTSAAEISMSQRDVAPPDGNSLDWLYKTIIIVGLIALGVVVAMWWARTVRDWVRQRQITEAAPDIAPEVVAVPAVPTIAEAAVGRQFDPRAAADAIVSCWLWVEKAAAAQGVPREDQDTPTEFLQRYLDQTSARHPGRAEENDRRTAAAAALLPLYQRARFDQAALTETAALQARDAALALGAGKTRGRAADVQTDPDRPAPQEQSSTSTTAGSTGRRYTRGGHR